jgi:hypothetical protein
MLRRVLIAVLALAFFAASAAPAAYAQAQAPAPPPPAATPPASVPEFQGASCLVGGAAAAAVSATVSRGVLSFVTAAAAGCAIGWLASPYLLTVWRKVQ